MEEWGYSRGMNEIVGPLGYSDQDKEGLLVEGFEYSNMFATFITSVLQETFRGIRICK